MHKVLKLVNETIKNFAKIDILVNNVGIVDPIIKLGNIQMMIGKKLLILI